MPRVHQTRMILPGLVPMISPASLMMGPTQLPQRTCFFYSLHHSSTLTLGFSTIKSGKGARTLRRTRRRVQACGWETDPLSTLPTPGPSAQPCPPAFGPWKESSYSPDGYREINEAASEEVRQCLRGGVAEVRMLSPHT